MKSKIQNKTKTNPRDLLVKNLEKKWDDSPTNGIPDYYKTETHCPNAITRKFNINKKLEDSNNNTIHNKQSTTSNTIRSIKQEILIQQTDSLPQPSTSYNPANQLSEVDILKKILVRERLLCELGKLLQNRNDVYSVLGEVEELIKAIRYQTLDVVEEIYSWQQARPLDPDPTLLYRGQNYLVKVGSDFDFLDQYDEVVEKMCLEFKYNPFAWRGGGEIIKGPQVALPYLMAMPHHQNNQSGASSLTAPVGSRSFRTSTISEEYSTLDPRIGSQVDGIPVSRLRSAERIVQGEVERAQRQGLLGGQGLGHRQEQGLVQGQQPNDTFRSSNSMGGEGGAVDVARHENTLQTERLETKELGNNRKVELGVRNGAVKAKTRKGIPTQGPPHPRVLVPNSKKIKVGRISKLIEEGNELRAMQAYIEDQIFGLSEVYSSRRAQRDALEAKRREASSNGSQAAAIRSSVEISIIDSDLQSLTSNSHALQLKSFHLGEEVRRKISTARRLRDEIRDQERKEEMQKKIEQTLRTEGLGAALKVLEMLKKEAGMGGGGAGEGCDSSVKNGGLPNQLKSIQTERKGERDEMNIRNDGDEGNDDDDDEVMGRLEGWEETHHIKETEMRKVELRRGMGASGSNTETGHQKQPKGRAYIPKQGQSVAQSRVLPPVSHPHPKSPALSDPHPVSHLGDDRDCVMDMEILRVGEFEEGDRETETESEEQINDKGEEERDQTDNRNDGEIDSLNMSLCLSLDLENRVDVPIESNYLHDEYLPSLNINSKIDFDIINKSNYLVDERSEGFAVGSALNHARLKSNI